MKLILILFFVFLPLPVFSFNNLLITEVRLADEIASNSFIKIFNPSEIDIDISNFRIRRKSSTGREYSVRVFPRDSFISSQDYFIWANSQNDYHISLGADVYSTASLSDNNSIALFSGEGDLIDSLAWGSGENQFVSGEPFPYNPPNKESIKRIKNGEYQNSKDNSLDFYLPSKKVSLVEIEKKESFLLKDTNFPLSQAISFSLFLALIFLFIRRNCQA